MSIFQAIYDEDLDVLTSWRAYIDGELAQELLLTQTVSLELDE